MVAATKPTTIQKAVQIGGTLIDEAIRNGLIKKNPEKRGNGGEPSKDRNGRDDNKRTRTENAFAITTNHCNRQDILPKDVDVPRNAQKSQGKPSKPVVAINEGQGHGNNGNQTCGRAFMLGAEEAHQDLNIVTGMDWLSNYKVEIIFHEKVVRIPLPDGKVLRVQGKRPEEKMRHLEVQFLGHVINGNGIHVDPSKTEAVKNWEALKTSSKLRWIELFSDYDCEIRYHPSKENVVADALSRKEKEEASDKSAGLQKGLDEMIERRDDGVLYYLDRIWVPLKGVMRTEIMDEAHK
ncbi:hypothetical protein Tco_0686111 [Tanacetum coccineum]